MINDKIAIIGAGPSGIAACQVLQEREIPFDCFEKGSDVGGLWRYENDSALASAYHSLHLNTSRETAQYASYPMPEDYPDFPHHTQMLAYLEAYVERFGFRDKIHFRAEVRRVEPVDGAWEVQWRTSNGETQSGRYAAVLVANGHHWDPHWPDPAPAGTFARRVIHSHFYRTAKSFEDQNVLVVGNGASALDIACDTSRVSRMTFLTARRGAWIAPKYIGGVPIDLVSRRLQSRVPIAREVATGILLNLGSAMLARRITAINGRPEDHGLPKPDSRLARAIVTASPEVLIRIGHGRVRPKPWISRLDGDRICFEDGSAEDIDSIIYCTGYKISLPFLADEIINPKDNAVPLYKRVVHPDRPGLYFIGLIDLQGPVNPLSELQTQWVADVLQNKVALPSPSQMKQAVAAEDCRRRRRFGSTERHAIDVDYFPYLRALQRERKRRRRDAHKTSVAPRAQDVRLPA